MGSFIALQDAHGVSVEDFGEAMRAAAAEEGGEIPLFKLERGEITEPEFLDILRDELEPLLGHRPELHRFREVFFDALDPNEPMIDLMRECKRGGRRMAMLTNNVQEWEPLWRTMLPVDEIFELVIDSGWVGYRKPERQIYEITLERLGRARLGLPLRRRHRGELRRGAGARLHRGPLPRPRAGDRRGPRTPLA